MWKLYTGCLASCPKSRCLARYQKADNQTKQAQNRAENLNDEDLHKPMTSGSVKAIFDRVKKKIEKIKKKLKKIEKKKKR